MKRIFYLIIITLTIISCQSADEKLTEEEWILELENITYNEGTDSLRYETIYYKKSDRELVLKFDLDGKVDISEQNDLRYATALWRWEDDKKHLIISVKDKDLPDIIKLDKKLTILKIDSKSNITKYMVLRKSSDEDRINDNLIDGFNKNQNHQ